MKSSYSSGSKALLSKSLPKGYGGFLIVAVAVLSLVLALPYFVVPKREYVNLPGPETSARLFEVQAIDTMKTSRDMARLMLSNRSYDEEIDSQIRLIKEAGATHVAVATPYDDEFLPVLRRWVASARAHGISVWFRGNFSGWENWFGYADIDKEGHKRLLSEFLAKNSDLFESGDIFSPCPECENGGPGDPRRTGDIAGFNEFLLEEDEIATKRFEAMGKDIRTSYSMNADIAREILNEETTKKIRGAILIDHYVALPDMFARDVTDISKRLGRDIGIGEFGAPIPDVHGALDESSQATYTGSMLERLYEHDARVPFISYWTLKGGSTALVEADGNLREVYKVIAAFFKARAISGKVVDRSQKGLSNAVIRVANTSYSRTTDKNGYYRILVPSIYKEVVFSKDSYKTATITLDASTTPFERNVILEKE